jgi:ankyrin repeat protein
MTIVPADPQNLYEAADWGDATEVYNFLEAKASPDERGPGGKTPLIRACERDDHNSIIQLLRFGANPNLAADDGTTAMHAAARKISTTGMLLRLIIKEGSMLARDSENRQPIDVAEENPAADVRALVAEFTVKELDAVTRSMTELPKAVKVSKPLGFKR